MAIRSKNHLNASKGTEGEYSRYQMAILTAFFSAEYFLHSIVIESLFKY